MRDLSFKDHAPGFCPRQRLLANAFGQKPGSFGQTGILDAVTLSLMRLVA